MKRENMQDALRTAWNNRIVGYVLVTLSAVTALFLLRWNQHHPGVAVAVLGLAAAMTAIRELTPLEKFIWAFVFAGLVFAEVHAIEADRLQQDTDHKNDVQKINDNFAKVLSDFGDQQKRLSATLNAALQSSQQTTPHADLLWTDDRIYAFSDKYAANSPYTVNIKFQDIGTADAEHLHVMSKVYVAKNEDENAPREAVKKFVDAWNAWRPGPNQTSDSPGAPEIDKGRVFNPFLRGQEEQRQFHVTFSSEEANDLNTNRSRVFFITRMEYSDATGKWRLDRCRRLKTPLTEDVIYNGCSIFNHTTRISLPK